MIPALERAAIILSRLLGLARFHSTKDSIGFNAAQITKLMDIVSCLTLVSHKILLLTMEELELFSTFSSWLRFEIDKLASSSVSEDISEKEATLDNSRVLTYIQQYLTTSPLALYLDEVAQDDYTNDWQHAEDGLSLLDMLDKQLQRHESGQPCMRALPHLEFLVNYLTSRSNAVFSSIAESQKRSVRMGRETKLDIGSSISKYDVRMCAKQGPVSRVPRSPVRS
jgi:anaphase-promoting complex subunit 4